MNKNLKLRLRGQAHALKPVVIIGANQLTPAVLLETDVALNAHELIKIRVNAENRDDRHAMINEICTQMHAELVTTIGHIAVIYRLAKK
jgi:RNA-binding protein